MGIFAMSLIGILTRRNQRRAPTRVEPARMLREHPALNNTVLLTVRRRGPFTIAMIGISATIMEASSDRSTANHLSRIAMEPEQRLPSE
jgi:hypothetical protein